MEGTPFSTSAGVDDSAGAHTMAGREVALTAKRAGKQSKGAALCRKARLAAHPGRGKNNSRILSIALSCSMAGSIAEDILN